MRSTYTVWLALILLAGMLWPTVSQATHVRAGEITTRRLPGPTLTYEITLTVYYDIIGGRDAAAQGNEYTICFGDGNSRLVRRLPPRQINSATTINIYRTTYTYAGPGTYTISAQIPNRNEGTINIGPGRTDGITFYVSTTILVPIGPLGANSTPVLLNPPLDSARVGQRYCHNPAAFDADGDSLAYRLSVPQQSSLNNPCRGFPVGIYRDPALGLDPAAQNEGRSGPATFTINPRTGDLCWDAPAVAGQYNVAFIIEEWRGGVLIGEITRDMQIIVTDAPNRRPQLQIPQDICVEAGQLINFNVTATDPDGHRVVLTAYGGPFNRNADNTQFTPPLIGLPVATFTPFNTPQNQPATGTFTWQTSCAHIRDLPYDVIFRVNDAPPRPITPLATLQSMRIRVVGPRPQNLTARPTATADRRAIQLNWTPYNCGPADTEIFIYRKEGCDNTQPQACQTGILPGYTLIGRVPATTSTFTDTTNLRRGVSYSYRIVAQYPLPAGGESIASAEACLNLPLLVPLITQVTVDSTGPNPAPRGVITVRWSRPLGLRPGDLGAPYQYRLFRAEGLTGTNFTPVTTINTNLDPNVVDTVFVDRTGLNTTTTAYRYRIEFFFTSNGQLTRLDQSDPASSVRLAAQPAQRQIQLSWQASTPWSNDNQRHRIYRSRRGPNGPFNLIAEVAVQGPDTYRFTDNGGDTFAGDGLTAGPLSADSSYCYRVETIGRYTNPIIRLVPDLLSNFSQIICATPIDTTRPCPPVLRVDSLNCASLTPESLCNQDRFTNLLNWTYPNRPECDARLRSYRIYYSRYDGETLTRIDSTIAPTTTYRHENLLTVAGCYEVTAVNQRGLESARSNRVCVDACPALVLPNVFTPNGDGRNDVFAPLACPRFVESITFTVVNRWGAKVFETTDPNINWNGNTTNGQPLPGGLYYYQASVRFATLNRSAPPTVYKGWIELIRESTTGR